MPAIHEIAGRNLSLEAAADLSGKQYYLVKVDGDGKAALAGAGENAVGVLQDKPASGAFGCVQVDGVSQVIAGEAINEGDLISATAAGKAQVAASGEFIVGRALTAAGADAEYFSMLVHSAGAKVP
jgi:hypothetical protein